MKRIMMRKSLTLSVGLLSLSLIFYPGSVPAQAPIKVGIIDTYAGPPTTYTFDVRDAFKLAIDEINAKGGVLGRKIEFTTRDDKFKVDLALSMAKELVMNEKVDILMGTINSAGALAVSEFCKTEKIPFLVTFSKSDKITGEKGHRYVFSITENTAMIGKAAAVGLSKRPFMKYWIAGDDYEYGHALADGVWGNLKKIKPNVELVGQSWWKVGEPDLTPYLTAISAAKPDAVIFATGCSQYGECHEGSQGHWICREDPHLHPYGDRAQHPGPFRAGGPRESHRNFELSFLLSGHSQEQSLRQGLSGRL